MGTRNVIDDPVARYAGLGVAFGAAFGAGGGIIYVMIYLLALGFSGIDNLVLDGIFLVCTLVSLWQVSSRTNHTDPA